MVGVPGSLTDKFKAAKAAGFGAIELNAPGIDVAETKKAISQSGLPVDGTLVGAVSIHEMFKSWIVPAQQPTT